MPLRLVLPFATTRRPPRVLRVTVDGAESAGNRAPSNPAGADDGNAHRMRVGAGAPQQGSWPPLLIIDDDIMMHDIIPRKLRRALGTAPQTFTAATPEEGLRLVAELAPAPLLVLSDYDLRASMDGVTVLIEAARIHPRSTRVLFSGHSRAEIGEEALAREEIHAFLEKPMRLDEMIPHLVDLLSGAARQP